MPTAREIRLPVPHPRFRARIEGSGRAVTHPGTAVRISEELFEVVSSLNAGGEWIYRLEPWTGDHTIRVYVEWGEEAKRKFLEEIQAERVQGRKKALAGAAQPLLGFLPAKHQERLSSSFEFDPVRATFFSAVLEILASLLPAVSFVLQFLGAGGKFSGFIPAWAGILAAVALFDGLVRLIFNVSLREPVGSLFLAVFGLRLRKEARADVMSDEYAVCGDSLVVRSPVAKAWWERAGGIVFRGEPFTLVDSEREGTRRLYRFQKGGSGFPEAEPAVERARNIASTRSYALAPLWGFLRREDQAALEFYGRYRPRPYVRLSIAFNLLLSASIVVPDLTRLGLGAFGGWTVLRFVFAAFLLGESLVRLLRHLQTGEVSGSFLGIFVKPVYFLTVGPSDIRPEAEKKR